MSGDDAVRAAALALASRGIAVFPQRRDKSACVKGWPDLASTDPERVAAWWREFPGANVACCVGRSGLVVVDVDRHRADGFDTLTDTERTLGPLPPTVTSASGGGGEHRYFRATGGERYVEVGPGLEILAGRRAATLPPSIHKSGRPYRWTSCGPLATLPAAWAALAAPKPVPERAAVPRDVDVADGYVRRAIEGEVGRVLNSVEGTRGNTLNRAAFSIGTIVGAGLGDVADVEGPLVAAGVAVGIEERAARDTVRRALRAGAARPRRMTLRRGRSSQPPSARSLGGNRDNRENSEPPRSRGARAALQQGAAGWPLVVRARPHEMLRLELWRRRPLPSPRAVESGPVRPPPFGAPNWRQTVTDEISPQLRPDSNAPQGDRDPTSGRFKPGNTAAKRANAWARRAMTYGERRRKANVARRLRRAERGTPGECSARAMELVLAERFLADVAALDGPARVSIHREAAEAADLIRSIEFECAHRPSEGIDFDPIP